jgi:N-acetyl-gamma-glutamyl-phosphate reductase
MKKIFIDGSAGTTGLRIRERLADRDDLEVMVLPEELRKDVSARRDALNSCDVAFLCLPDAAAIEAEQLVENPDTVVIDTSTAHRTNDDWAYGFPELEGLRERIRVSKRIANPGCHASGFIALVEPLIRKGLLSRSVALSAVSLTGFSGGGKKMIADYENIDELKLGGRQYALAQKHKHLPEIVKLCGLETAPAFMPIVVPHHSGMEVTVPLFAKDINGSPADIKALYASCYNAGLVRFVEDPSEDGFLSSAKLSGSDAMELSVYGNDERILLVARFDNLGKGASGAAIQNMNIAIGAGELAGLAV